MQRMRRTELGLIAAAVVLASGGGLAVAVASSSGAEDPAAHSATSTSFVGTQSTAVPTLFYIAGANFEPVDTTDQVAPNGRSLVGISAEGNHGLPEIAKAAYQRAARTIEQTRPGCNLPWTLLAGIGRVESDHGRYGGSVLGVDGYPRPRIRGVALNGIGPVAAIRDSDNGKLDGDKVWDRAVGPMQFIPTTWAVSGRDGDGDGVSDPNDIDDAALAAAGYLCPSSGSINSESTKRAAVFSYNHSDYYVDLVLAFARGYETGVFALPSPPVVVEPEEVDEASDEAEAKPTPKPKSGKSGDKNQGGSAQASGTGGSSGGSGAGSSSGSTGGKTGGGSGGTKPAPPPKQPEPSQQPEPPKETLELRAVSGAWTGCGATWCLSGFPLDLGAGGQLDRTALKDLDGDGALESYRAEFTGMTGTILTVYVKQGTNVVYIVKGVGYRNRDGSFA